MQSKWEHWRTVLLGTIWHFVVFVTDVSGRDTANGFHEKALYRHVTQHYDPNSRPVRLALAPVNVSVLIQIKRLMELDEKKQVLTTSVIIHEQWQDENIAWKPSKFGNLKYLVVPTTHIWLPDIYVYNNALVGNRGFVHIKEARALVSKSRYSENFQKTFAKICN